jgi:Ca-activated chloride channel family protein
LNQVKVEAEGGQAVTYSDPNGIYRIQVPVNSVMVFSKVGYLHKKSAVPAEGQLNILLERSALPPHAKIRTQEYRAADAVIVESDIEMNEAVVGQSVPSSYNTDQPAMNTDEFTSIQENIFHQPSHQPLSTFSIDVDVASYAILRKHLVLGQLPPTQAIRIEEMINYFIYDYPEPAGTEPFSIFTEATECPWNEQHRLLMVGIQGKNIPVEQLPPANLVFLVDVSGSMESPDKLPLVQSAFRRLTNQLRPQDRVSVVVYAGAAGLVLPSTPGTQKEKILAAIDKWKAGGSTAGGAGIELAYQVARENFVEGGNNRIILTTDGDFNVGTSSTAALEELIVKKRETGIFLTVLGFGSGNLKDSRMETLADKGNGNYAYIDNLREAEKVLVQEFGGTLFTIAKDVKIQLEFNPVTVAGYRLIGYENRVLRSEDFKDDKKDAGELGSGHTVTALYEIIPAGTESDFLKPVDDLKFSKVAPNRNINDKNIAHLKLRYKEPEGEVSRQFDQMVNNEILKGNQVSENLRFAASVASFGLILRDSEFKGNASLNRTLEMAENSMKFDPHGYRREFTELVRNYHLTARK